PYVRDVLARIIAGDGDSLPVSAFPCDGTFPTDTARWEKRNLALEIPVWDPEVCIQCGKCVMVCPHATIRMKVCDEANLAAAPPAFKWADARAPEFKGRKYTIQVAPEDCTGCELCVHVCPAKNRQDPTRKAINMEPQPPLRAQQAVNWDFFRALPEVDRAALSLAKVRTQQFQQPLFEFSGACAGCGETPYIKLLSQLFGDRALIANATGCSSIYGGNLPTTPWARDPHGRGPAWSNSLFEDNAEFGMGMRLAVDQLKQQATELLLKLTSVVGDELAAAILNAQQKTDADIQAQRARVVELKHKLAGLDTPEARRLLAIADNLVKRSVWIVGGDGWAYDIGYGGLDHVLASGRNVNVLVLDTEVYSNTGGQMSKSTPRGAVAKFAAGGKPAGKKNLGLMAMSYGNVYVAQVAMGARDEHTLQAFLEAEAFDGPSLIIAYAHCIAHGINMVEGLDQQKAAVDSGQWLLFRYHPDRAAEGRNPLQIDSKEPRISVADYMMKENRFRMLTKSDPQRARELFDLAADDARRRREVLTLLASQWASTEPAPAAKDTAEPVKTGS
ncbi:MAG TPA: 4Fe-4S double cluster binding domain-containing protein, partial [Candidatus Sumerlaeota bacterium]|nr:4Fe-4S double cluster binding domain-containing protein [Candidatus Sumerlaeota bacterium]